MTALIDEDIRKIAIELDENEYGVALRAHGEERSIRCTGIWSNKAACIIF